MPLNLPIEPTVVLLQTGHADLHTEERELLEDIRQRVNESIHVRDCSGTVPILWSEGAVKSWRLTGNTTFTLPLDLPMAEGGEGGQPTSITMRLGQDGSGGRTVEWPPSTTLKWAGGSQPTLTSAAGREDWFTFVTLDGGTTWAGFVVARDVR
jgi:hypothetical protein